MYTDEFSGEITSCQMNIGDSGRGQPRLAIFQAKKEPSLIGLNGRHNASGYMYKIDDNEVVKKGRDSVGGDTYWGTPSKDFLTQLTAGQKIIIRTHSENQFGKSSTKKYSLAGSTKAVSVYEKCVSEINLTK